MSFRISFEGEPDVTDGQQVSNCSRAACHIRWSREFQLGRLGSRVAGAAEPNSGSDPPAAESGFARPFDLAIGTNTAIRRGVPQHFASLPGASQQASLHGVSPLGRLDSSVCREGPLTS